MTVHGVGTDLVEVARFERLIGRGGRRFLDRWFTPGEVDYCLARDHPARHVAARFAAKEAVLKALRLSGDGPLRWREIEVCRDADGLPSIVLHGTFRQQADAVGVEALHVSLSHDGRYATATALVVRSSGSRRSGRAE